MPERGPDGLLTPYSDEEVRRIIAEYAASLACRLPSYEAPPYRGLLLRAFTHQGGDYHLGPVIQLGVWADGQLVGACSFERDISAEVDDDYTAAWIAQSLFVHPDHQRRGIGALMLRTLRQLAGLPLAPDTHMSRASAELWATLRDALECPPTPQDATTNPAIAAFRRSAHALVADATSRYQEA